MGKQKSVISWSDVHALIRQMEKSYHCYGEFVFASANHVDGDDTFSIALNVYERSFKGKGKVVYKGHTHFPQRRHWSITGACVWLLYEAVKVLEDRQEIAKQDDMAW